MGVQRAVGLLLKFWPVSWFVYKGNEATQRGGDLPKVTWQMTVANSVAVLAFFLNGLGPLLG